MLLFSAVCVTAAVAGADQIAPEILSLARIQHKMADELKRLPNYSCMETVDRYTSARGARPKPFDRIRIQVAIVDGRELYSWPGATVFSDQRLPDMVQSGFVGDGDFASMTRNIFIGKTATIRFSGEEQSDGRKLLRYEFRIPQMLSGWTVRLGGSSGVVGAAGSFWADAETYDLVRLQFEAQDLPPFSQDRTIAEDVTYARVHLGESEILLPAAMDLTSESFNGDTHWNHGTFTQCRKYAAESSISFGDEDDLAKAVSGKVEKDDALALPAEIDLHVQLEKAIDCRRAAVGDEVRAMLAKDLKVDRVLFRKGTAVKGIVRKMALQEGNRPYYEVGLEFTGLEGGGRRASFVAQSEQVAAFPGYHKNVVGFGVPNDRRSFGVAYFYVDASMAEVPAGVGLTLVTGTLRTR